MGKKEEKDFGMAISDLKNQNQELKRNYISLKDKFDNLEKRFELLQLSGTYDLNKVTVNLVRDMWYGFVRKDEGVFSGYRPRVTYIKNGVGMMLKLDRIFELPISSDQSKCYEILHNDEDKAIIRFDIDGASYWYMLDKKKENLFEIPEPAEFATPKETKTDEPSSRSQLSLIRKMLLEKMGGKVPSHISTVEMFQRYLDDMDDGEE